MMGDWFFGVGILIEGDGDGFELGMDGQDN